MKMIDHRLTYNLIEKIRKRVLTLLQNMMYSRVGVTKILGKTFGDNRHSMWLYTEISNFSQEKNIDASNWAIHLKMT